MSLSSDEEELDNTWVDDYKSNEDKYNEFYNEKVNTIKVFFMYVNSEKVVVNIKQEILTLSISGTLKREQLITLVKEKQFLNTIKYKLYSIVKYNIDLQPEEVDEFISANDTISVCDNNNNTISVCDNNNNTIRVCDNNNNTISDNNNIYANRFLIPENYINDIYFTDTISIFQDLNSLYIIFKEDTKKHSSKTKKNKYNTNNNNKRYTRHK